MCNNCKNNRELIGFRWIDDSIIYKFSCCECGAIYEEEVNMGDELDQALTKTLGEHSTNNF